jgi:copper transport protein
VLPIGKSRRPALIAALLVLLASVLGSTLALAHATLVSSEPRDGAVVPVAPSELSLHFNEPVQPLVLRLVDPTGTATTLTDHHAAGNSLVVRVPPRLGQGTHVLSWRVVSADGHPVSGSVLFAIGAPSSTPTLVTGDSSGRPVRVAIWLARVSLLLASFIGIGGVFFAAWVGTLEQPARAVVVAALQLGIVAAPLSIGLQGLDLSLQPLAGLRDPATWKLGFFSPPGVTASIAFGALLAGLFSLDATDRRLRRPLAAVALAGVGAAFVASGHVSTADPRIVSGAALFVHMVSIAFWTGALVPLLALTLAGRHGHALESFSRAIPIPLAALVASGVLLAAIQLDHYEALWSTSYGQVLSLKLAILVGLLVLAGINRFALTPALRAGSKRADRRLVGTVSAELVLVLLILGTVAVWRFTPPPRSLAAAGPVYTHIHTDRAMADVTVARVRGGRSRISVLVRTPDFRPLPAKEVGLVLANPEAGIEPFSRTAKPADDGTWLIEDVILPAQGTWAVTVEVLIGDFERLELTGNLVLKR